MEIQEKAPLHTRGDIDKNIDKNDVIRILQKYKTAKCKLLQRRIHLVWEDGVIDWCEAEKTTYEKRDPSIETEIKKELAKMRDHINFSEKQIEGVQEQYNAGILCRVVEGWLSELNPRAAEILFCCYINHDYEKKYGIYAGLSEIEIAQRMGITPRTVTRIKARALRNIFENHFV